MSARDIAAAARLVAEADALLVCAGAGIGVDSGLPDFRGDAGFWRAYPPYERLGLSFPEAADPAHFAEDPAFAWGFYGHRLGVYRRAEPHAGFAVLRGWAEQARHGARVFTSNVDGQFQKAGFDPATVTECHGSIHHLQCLQPCTDEVWPAGDLRIPVDTTSMRARGTLPACPRCGGTARPNILMFGDWSWIPEPSQRQLDALTAWRRDLGDARLVVVELGAGTAIPTVRRHAELASADSGALIRINPREPGVRAGIPLQMGSLDALQAIDQHLGTHRPNSDTPRYY